MRTIRLTGITLGVAFVAAGWAGGTALAVPLPEPTVQIRAQAVSACDMVMMMYSAPEGAQVEIYRSQDDGTWERQVREPYVRFDQVRGPVRYKITLGDQEAVSEQVSTYQCSEPGAPS